MTPYEQKRERLRKIAARAKPQDIWAQVYAATYAANQHKGMPVYVAGIARVAADDAVQQFERIVNEPTHYD